MLEPQIKVLVRILSAPKISALVDLATLDLLSRVPTCVSRILLLVAQHEIAAWYRVVHTVNRLRHDLPRRSAGPLDRSARLLGCSAISRIYN